MLGTSKAQLYVVEFFIQAGFYQGPLIRATTFSGRLVWPGNTWMDASTPNNMMNRLVHVTLP